MRSAFPILESPYSVVVEGGALRVMGRQGGRRSTKNEGADPGQRRCITDRKMRGPREERKEGDVAHQRQKSVTELR